VSCPKCGGEQREAIAPGFWECHSSVLIEVMEPGPNPLNPRQVIPTPVTYRVRCGEQYQEGGSDMAVTPACGCGTYSIGHCAACRTPVCGQHSRLVEDRRLCKPCAQVVYDQRAEVQRIEAARQRQEEILRRNAQAQDEQNAKAWCATAIRALSARGMPGAPDLYPPSGRKHFRISRYKGYKVGSHSWVDARGFDRSIDQVILADGELVSAHLGDKQPTVIPLSGTVPWTQVRQSLERLMQTYDIGG
jgi:hypothetical protein